MIAELPFNASRVATLRRGDKVMVMDRSTGRSVYVKADEDVLKLIATGEERLPPELTATRRQAIAELADQGIGVSRPPRFESLNTLILKMTNACNYACTYCYDYEPEETAAHLELDLALRALSEALELCEKGLQIIFHGGEPFLRFQNIKQIVMAGEEMAARLGKTLVFSGQTNLSMLTEESVSFSMEHGINWGFSLDGPARTNNFFRVLKNGAGTHNRFEQALERFPEFVRGCSCMATITSANHDNLLGISRYFRDCGLAGWDWTLFQPIGRGRPHYEIDFDVTRLIASWNELFDALADGEFDGFLVSPVAKYIENFINGPGRNMCMRQDCGAGRDLLSISSDGQIEACDCLDPKGPYSNLGNVKLTTLTRARDSETAQLIRSRDTQKLKCHSCIWLAVCGGTCLARASSLHGVYENECQVALNAFDRVSLHLAESTRLLDYMNSCYG
jgi:uncharacterized protein